MEGFDISGIDPECEFWGADRDHAREVLAQLEDYSRTHPAFAGEWAVLLRQAADRTCAEIAGRRMAGLEGEQVYEGHMQVPCPGHGFASEDVFAAFGLALLAEVSRRVEVMTQYGAGGIG